VRRFAALLDQLAFSPARNSKLRLLAEYFATAPDPDRGYALAALTGALDLAQAKPALVRALAAERIDPVLFEWSYDFVGDLAETAALIWPAPETGGAAAASPGLAEVVAALRRAGKREVPHLLAGWLDGLDASGRWALLKLITGGLRVGVSARLARLALAEWAKRDAAEVEEVFHAAAPPYQALFAWLAGEGPRPALEALPLFRPFMLATALEEREIAALPAEAYAAEWKWDGIRVQVTARGGERRIYSRSGDEIGGTFPDLLAAMDFDATLDGELLVLREGEVASFNALQQRLNRKEVTPALLREYPAHVRLYDLLFDDSEDLRPHPFLERRRRLEAWYRARPRPRFDISPLIPFREWEELAKLRREARESGIEGLMLKRKDSPYLAGRPKGPWFKWKRDALTIDAVLMYAQRGHGKRSSFYSDYTFGCWRDGELVPVGKAYFGFTDEELASLDRWIRGHTVNRFGPVREVEKALVFEVAFDSAHRSARHKSGVALRFPRIHRIRWDKPAEEADRLESLKALIRD
jgi:DNA ligase-1